MLQETEVGVDLGASLLKRRRVDGVVLSEDVGDKMVINASSGKIKKLDIMFYQQPIYLVFSHRQYKLNTETIQSIWQQITLSRNEPLEIESH